MENILFDGKKELFAVKFKKSPFKLRKILEIFFNTFKYNSFNNPNLNI